MIFQETKRVLVISAHADDMEFGCGATINKLIERGAEIYSLVLSLNQKGVPTKFSTDDIKEEIYQSGKILGLKRKNIFIESFENRVFYLKRQEILDLLWQYRRKLKPNLIFTLSLDDMHQDHSIVAKESFRAFKECDILSYGFDWNKIKNRVNMYSIISKKNLEKKIMAIQSYQSQMDHRKYFSADYIRSLAIVRGTEIKENYAETFEVNRLIY